ncbi:MAG: hypothetical protein AVDCRST_MAG52-558, partial [uncultured Blastococcus sp.]
ACGRPGQPSRHRPGPGLHRRTAGQRADLEPVARPAGRV